MEGGTSDAIERMSWTQFMKTKPTMSTHEMMNYGNNGEEDGRRWRNGEMVLVRSNISSIQGTQPRKRKCTHYKLLAKRWEEKDIRRKH